MKDSYLTEKGSALVLVLITVAILATLGTAMMSLSVGNYRKAVAQEKDLQALALAEAGVSETMNRIRGINNVAQAGSIISSYTGTIRSIQVGSQTVGRYEIMESSYNSSTKTALLKIKGVTESGSSKQVNTEITVSTGPVTSLTSLFIRSVASSGKLDTKGAKATINEPKEPNANWIPQIGVIDEIINQFGNIPPGPEAEKLTSSTTSLSRSTVMNSHPKLIYHPGPKLELAKNGNFHGRYIIVVKGDVVICDNIGLHTDDQILIISSGTVTIEPPGNREGRFLLLANKIDLGGSGNYKFNGSMITNDWTFSAGNPEFSWDESLKNYFDPIFIGGQYSSIALDQYISGVSLTKWQELN